MTFILDQMHSSKHFFSADFRDPSSHTHPREIPEGVRVGRGLERGMVRLQHQGIATADKVRNQGAD